MEQGQSKFTMETTLRFHVWMRFTGTRFLLASFRYASGAEALYEGIRTYPGEDVGYELWEDKVMLKEKGPNPNVSKPETFIEFQKRERAERIAKTQPAYEADRAAYLASKKEKK